MQAKIERPGVILEDTHTVYVVELSVKDERHHLSATFLFILILGSPSLENMEFSREG
jgi:hypothetical protein